MVAVSTCTHTLQKMTVFFIYFQEQTRHKTAVTLPHGTTRGCFVLLWMSPVFPFGSALQTLKSRWMAGSPLSLGKAELPEGALRAQTMREEFERDSCIPAPVKILCRDYVFSPDETLDREDFLSLLKFALTFLQRHHGYVSAPLRVHGRPKNQLRVNLPPT